MYVHSLLNLIRFMHAYRNINKKKTCIHAGSMQNSDENVCTSQDSSIKLYRDIITLLIIRTAVTMYL